MLATNQYRYPRPRQFRTRIVAIVRLAPACLPLFPPRSISAHSSPNANAPTERADDLSLCAAAPAACGCPAWQALRNSAAILPELVRKSRRNSLITSGIIAYQALRERSHPPAFSSSSGSRSGEWSGARQRRPAGRGAEGWRKRGSGRRWLSIRWRRGGSHFCNIAFKCASCTGLLR